MDVMAEVGACCVAEVMGTELFTLTPDTVVASARRLAFDHGIRHLLVLDGGTLTGIVCDEDLRTSASRAAAPRTCDTIRARAASRCAPTASAARSRASSRRRRAERRVRTSG